MASEVIVFTGIPASGKTTFYKECFFPAYMYISLDQVRSRSAESELFDFCLKRHRSCVIDNTNVKASDRARYIIAAKAAKMRVIGYCFVAHKDSALARNSQREGRARVPRAAIRTMYNALEYPKPNEGFDELFYVTITEGGFKVEAFDEKRNQ